MGDSPGELLDDFRDVSGWAAFTSGQVELGLAADAGALRLDFDFKGGGGFAVARKVFERALPRSWALRLRIRGEAPRNRFELKVVDRSGRSVWWYCRDAFEFPVEWRELRIRSHEIEFAWGPAGGGAPADLGALELAIAAGPGGRGRVWIADLRFEDLEYRGEPRRSETQADGRQRVAFDFGHTREFGALRLDWAHGDAVRAFDVELSDDAREWRGVYSTARAGGRHNHVYLPGAAARHLRVALREPPGALRGIEVVPQDEARSLLAFLGNAARGERRGLYPRYLYGEQSHWTAVGSGDGSGVALLGEDGALEVDRAGFSLEPFVHVDGRLVTWGDAAIEQALAPGGLPLPSCLWRFDGLELEVAPTGAGAAIHVHYRLRNPGRRARRVRLFAALRPFQVTPPWQAFQGLGGPSPIRELELGEDGARVNGHARVIPLLAPSGFGAAAFEQGGIGEFMARGELPERTWIRDRLGCASGAFVWDLELAPGGASDVALRLPFSAREEEVATPERRELGRSDWERRLGRVGIRTGPEAREHVDALRSATAHILINREGAALQPGPRRYARSWIRDGAVMASALLRAGLRDEVRDFLRWYAPHQAADGNVPCCVDRDGPDWLAEHDSHGQFIFAVAEYFRFSRDRSFLAELWPRVLKAADHLVVLRAQRLTPEYDAPDRLARRGILPESVSHEGYMAHPVHAYWDDFWALRGLADAAELSRALGGEASGARLRAQHDALRDSLYASIMETVAQRGLDFVPASVEWADHDPTATSMALVITDAAARLPAAALARTYDLYLDGFRRRSSGTMEWQSYTPYEIRNAAALVRLGRRSEAHELLAALLADRRPRVWNQWPEIVWRDPKAPAHLGDLPHTWVGAEYALAFLSLFAYECPVERALVVAAGIPDAWLAGAEGVAIEGLPTAYGSLSYSLRRAPDGALHLALRGELEIPPGGIIVRPPLRRPLERVALDGKSIDFEAASVTLDACPAALVMS